MDVNKTNKGFTLIELLIVVAIIGILAAVGAAVIPNILTNAKVSVAKMNYSTITKRVKEITVLCEIQDSIKLMKVWDNKKVYDVPCFDGGIMQFFQSSVSNDLTNSGALAKQSPYNNGGIWQRNGKTSSGYAPECQQDFRVGMVYAVYPQNTNNIEFCSCVKTPCSNSANRLQGTITVK